MAKSWITGPMAAAGVMAVVLAGLLALGASRAGARASGPVNRCSNTQIAVSPAGALGGAAGHIGLWYRIHQTWGSSCSLQGFPGVELLDRNFHSLPIAVTRDHGYIISDLGPARRVVLSPHQDAYFAIEYSDVPTQGIPCRNASYLLVIGPDDRLPVASFMTRSGTLLLCGGRADVSPVERKQSLH